MAATTTKRLISTLAVLMLIAVSAVHLGCGAAADANTSTDGHSAAESAESADDAKPAKNSTDGEESEADKDGDSSDDEGEDGHGDEDKEQAVPVEVVTLARGAIESVLRFSANLETEDQVQVFSQAKRLVTKRLAEEGDIVERGQLLIRLQNDEQLSALAKVKSQLEKAEREYTRQERLYRQELISETEYNDATYELEQLKISLEDAERELGYTEVRAPISGTVTNRMVNLGDQVQIGQHLFDIVDFNSIVARVFVPEKHLDELRKGLTARVAASGGGRDYIGKVVRIAPIVDPKSGTVKVTVAIGGQPGLRPGMYVDVDLVTATRNDAVLVPKRALVYDAEQMFVFRMGDERRVERVFVKASLADKMNIEPAEGLTEGDLIVVAGQAGLKDGALVSIPGDEDSEAATHGDDESDVERASL